MGRSNSLPLDLAGPELPVSPLREMIWRGLAAMGIVAAVFGIIPQTPLDGPVGGVIAFTTVILCSWQGGPIAATTFPILIFLLTRLVGIEAKPLRPTLSEIGTLCFMTILTVSVGLAGQYRRRYQRTTRHQQATIHQQARALSAARILFCDLTGRIVNWSTGLEQLYGWTAAEATGSLVQNLLGTQGPQSFAEIVAHLQHEGQWQGEVRQHDRHGGELTVMTHWIMMQGDDGSPTGIAQVHSDVTPLRTAEAAARESDHRKGVFLATLAHELRNPLAPLRSGLDLLSVQTDPSPEQREIVSIMQRQLSLLVRLIDDLLDISRINSGKIKLQRERVDLNDVIADAVAGVRTMIDDSQQTLEFHVPAGPLIFSGDRSRLAQVLTNLLHNASKFTGPRGEIALSAERDDGWLLLRVRDNGAGIRPDVRHRIFDMFSQDDNLHTRTHSGLGIGLSIVKSLVELHGGTVSVQSEGTGQGSEFLVRLPLSTETAEPKPEDAIPPSPGSTAASRVLVVDDNQDAARTLARLLTMSGCETETAFNGDAALRLAESFQPHIFVLDLGMPGMSGLDLARELRAKPEFVQARLIAVTGWGKDEDRRQSSAAGFDHHLVKPVDIVKLREIITTSPAVERPAAAAAASNATNGAPCIATT